MPSQNITPAVLRQCRDLVTERIRATVGRVVDETATMMERHTVGGTSSMPGSHAFDAIRELRQRRAEFAVFFEHRYQQLFDRCLREPAVDAEKAGQGLAADCRTALLEIDRRMETLRRVEGLAVLGNPMEPGVIIKAFSAACQDVIAGEPVRRALVESFQRSMGSELQQMYGDINALLARRGIRGASLNSRTTDSRPFASFPGRLPVIRSDAGVSRLPPRRDPEVMRLIEARIGAGMLPHFVRDFARDAWARVLTQIKVDKGRESPEWERAWKTLEDLVAGVEVFGDPGRRPTVIWTLPGLVKRIKAGLDSIHLPQQEQVLFLKTLRAHHLRVLGQRPMPRAMFLETDPEE